MSFDLPVLPQDWSYAPLDSCSQPNSVTYGVVQPGSALVAGKPLIRVNNFRDTRIDLSDVMYIAPEIEAKYNRTRLKGGEVLLTIVGSVGQVAVVPPQCAGFNVARAVAVIHPLTNIAPEWIALCLRSPLSQHLLGSRANTTVQTTINLKDLRALPIPLPPDTERRTIAEFVGALDDRITLLRETNATLEAIAQTLFKSWFVDFDPVRARMEGRAPEGMDEATAALFPDGFEESELGLVPRGWRVGSIGEHTSYLSRGISPKYIEDGGVVVINQKCIRDFSLDLSKARRHDPAQRKIDGREILQGDILVNSTGVGTLGRVAQVLRLEAPAIVDSHVTVIRAGTTLTWNYLGLAVMRKQPEIEEMGEGSTGQTELNRGKLAALKLLVPSAKVLQEFDSVVLPLRERFSANQTQAQTLATLRDTLLPRLISGQLRLPEAQAAAEDALA